MQLHKECWRFHPAGARCPQPFEKLWEVRSVGKFFSDEWQWAISAEVLYVGLKMSLMPRGVLLTKQQFMMLSGWPLMNTYGAIALMVKGIPVLGFQIVVNNQPPRQN